MFLSYNQAIKTKMEGVLVDYCGAMLTCYLLNTVTSSPMKEHSFEES